MRNTKNVSHGQAARLRKIHGMLRDNDRVTQADLAAANECSKKSIQRAVSMLQADGWPIEFDLEGYFLNPKTLDDLKKTENGNIAALVLTGCAIDQHLMDHFPSLALAARGSLPDVPDFQSFQYRLSNQLIAVDRCALTADELDTFGALARNIIDGIAVNFLYRAVSKEGEIERAVYPMCLKQRDGVWYLIAYDLEREAILVFAMKKIKKVKVCSLVYDRPSDSVLAKAEQWGEFSIWDTADTSASHDIKVKLYGHAADFVRSNKIHSSQRFEIIDSDTVMLYLKTSDLLGVNLWLRKFLNLVEIIEPEVLRESFKQDLKAALGNHDLGNHQ